MTEIGTAPGFGSGLEGDTPPLSAQERSPDGFGDGDVLYASSAYVLHGVGVCKRISVPQEDLRSGSFGARDVFDGVDPGRTHAFVAFPFRREEPAEILVPESLRDSVATDAREESGAAAQAARSHGSVLRVHADSTPDAWCRRVEQLAARVEAQELGKAVLARRITVTADRPFSKVRFLRALATSFPAGVVFAFRDYLGASPELLVSRHGTAVRSRPLAGTLPAGHGADADRTAVAELLSSPRFRREHRIVVEHITDALAPVLPELTVDPEPGVLTLPTVHHLATSIAGRCEPGTDVLRLAALLHPTPAVCGSPRSTAYEVIGELESWRRGLYAGAVGWVDRNGDGEFSVAIRCAELTGRQAHVFVGNGIVAGSSPLAELTETRAKISRILAALVEP